jgi:ABC-type glycerol-3-phosphate transport system substrate-binding protein
VRRLLAGLAVAGMTATLLSCGSGDDTSGGTSENPKVTLMTWADPKTRNLYKASLDKFTDKTGIEVELVYVGSAAQYFQKVNSMVLSNTLPDIFWCTTINATFTPLASSGKLFDWTPYLEGTAEGQTKTGLDKSKFGPGYLDFYKVDGKQYGIPNEANTYGAFYNADLFKEAGLPVPTSDWTWEDLFTAIEKLTVTEGAKVTRYGMQTAWGDLYDPVGLSIYSISNGGEAFAPERNWINVSEFSLDPQIEAGAQRWANAIKNGWVTGPDFTATNTFAAFINGQVPLVWGGQWNAAAIFEAKPKMEWGFAPIPAGTATQVAPLESNAFCSPADLENPDATWQVISYMLTDVFNDAYSEYAVAPIAYLPGSEGYFENLKQQGPIGEQVAATVRQELENPEKVGTAFIDPWSPKAGNLIKSHWNPMLEGKRPIKPTLDEYVTKVNELIEAGS